MSNPLAGVFRALGNFNFRIWTAGGFISNIGTWMQRTAQDWIVLTQLTHHNATAVGIVKLDALGLTASVSLPLTSTRPLPASPLIVPPTVYD